MKKKDALYVVIFLVVFIGGIALLMAWNDGYLDGTMASQILSVVFPAFVGSSCLMLAVSFWIKKVRGKIALWVMLVVWLMLFAGICLFLLSPLQDTYLVEVAIGWAIIIALTLIVFWITEGKN